MKTKTQIGYKVVRKHTDGKLYSWNECPSRKARLRGTSIRYRPGHTSRRRKDCGPLAVFTSLEDARRLLACYPPTNHPSPIYKVRYLLSAETKLFNREGDTIDVRQSVPGTAYADAVTLNKRPVQK